jgi:PGM1 C-terminal domain
MNKQDQEKFKQLQTQLREKFSGLNTIDQDNYDILVIPSFSIDQKVLKKVAGFLHYEERLLFSLIRLCNPHTRLIYLTSLPLSPLIRDYYLQLLSGIPFSHASDRLLLISTFDASLKPLTQKILERPRLVEKIKRALRPNKSYMVCFNSTILEQELSVKLEIPLFASSPDLLYWGSKSGSRQIFSECNIKHPDGSNQVNNTEELVRESVKLWEQKPHLKRLVIKLNEGFSGEGNAILNLPESTNNRELTIRNSLKNLSFQAKDETWDNFSQRIPELGAIVEEFIEGEEKRSPSVQGYITPTGKVEILSTHDQILGGPDGQIYLGCTFPADAEYRLQIQELGLKIGHFLAQKGAMERYGVDFIAVKKPDNSWDIQAIEINLRKGGTTHPFMTLQLLTNGFYNYQDGLFYTPKKHPKYYIATDNLQKPQYQGLLPSDLMDIIAKHHLHFDTSTKTGTVFHLMGALSEFGKLGLTSIGNSHQEAREIYYHVEQILDSETDPNIYYYSQQINPILPITWNS